MILLAANFMSFMNQSPEGCPEKIVCRSFTQTPNFLLRLIACWCRPLVNDDETPNACQHDGICTASTKAYPKAQHSLHTVGRTWIVLYLSCETKRPVNLRSTTNAYVVATKQEYAAYFDAPSKALARKSQHPAWSHQYGTLACSSPPEPND